jgi:GTP pyrophosphokinase
MYSFSEFLNKIKVNTPEIDEKKLLAAYEFGKNQHAGQKRSSGDDYFTHPIEVALILSENNLDGDAIIAALLHDTLEDTATSYSEIEQKFGPTVVHLVEGVTKLTNINFASANVGQAENFRKFFVAMSRDIRVLIIKLADRLHNMRTIGFRPEHKRQKKSLEVMEIFGPLAQRIGMNKIETELYNTAFAQLYPKEYAEITDKLQNIRQTSGSVTQDIINELQDCLNKFGITCQVCGREKTPHSIWRKMQRKGISFEQLWDIIAFRIITNNIEDCYKALGAIHANYSMVPGRFKDYISMPKSNGYRSIHTCVLGPGRRKIEVQIRTQEMNQESEIGVAAHWRYKQGGKGEVEGKEFDWIRNLLEGIESSSDLNEFWENTKIAMFQDTVFCFTPKGDLFSLPSESTPLDFAYAIHSDIGNHCTGAKINGRIRNLRYQLKNGDVIEIITSKAQTPSPEWERIVVSSKAKNAIRRYLKVNKRSQLIEFGKNIIINYFADMGASYDAKKMENMLPRFNAENLEDLYILVASGDLGEKNIYTLLIPAGKKTEATKAINDANLLKTLSQEKEKKQEEKGIIKGLVEGMPYHFARCCNPVFGDKIVGIINTGSGVTVHAKGCLELDKYLNRPERWVNLQWNDMVAKKGRYTGRITLLVDNKPGILGDISSSIMKEEGNIINVKVINRSLTYMEFLIDVESKGLEHLNLILSVLRNNAHVKSAERFFNK